MLKPRIVALTVTAVLLQAGAVLGLSPLAAAAPGDPLDLHAGDVVVSDEATDRVLVVEVDGDVRVLADDIDGPRGVAVTATGDVVVAESATGMIVKILADGSQQVLGTGIWDAWGLALSEDGSTVYATGRSYDTIAAIPIAGTPTFPVPNLGMTIPGSVLTGIAVAPGGDLVVADWMQSKAWRVHESAGSWSSTEITEFDGALFSPTGVAVTSAGDVYVADEDTNGVFRAPAGGGPVTQLYSLTDANGVAVDIDGSVLVVSRTTDEVVRIAADGSFIETLAGPGPAAGALTNPVGVAVVPSIPPTPPEAGDVFVGTSGGDVLEVADDGTTSVFATGLGPVTALVAQEDGTLLAGDTLGRLTGISWDGSTTLVHAFAGAIEGIATDPSGIVYVAEDDGGGGANLWRNAGVGWANTGGYGDPVVGLLLPPDGELVTAWTGELFRHTSGLTIGTASGLRGVAWDPAGDFVVADSFGPGRVLKVPITGGTFAMVYSGINQPVGIALDEVGNRIVGSAGANGLYRVTPDGLSVLLFASVPNLTAVTTYVPTPEISPTNPGDDTANVGTAYAGPDFDTTTPGGLDTTFSLYPGSDLPDGVELDPATGTVSGEPTESGTFTYRVQAANAARGTVTDEIDLVVGKRLQGLAFTSAVPMINDDEIGDHYTPTFSSVSGNPITLAIDAASAAVCEIDPATPTTVDYLAVGTCRIVATQAGDATYEPATVTQDARVDLFEQPLTFTNPAPAVPVVGGTHDASATSASSSGNPITYEVQALDGCTVDTEGLVTFTHVGACRVSARQAGDALHYLGSRTRFITVGPAEFAFTTTAPAPGRLGVPYTPATNLPSASFSVENDGTICSFDAGTGEVEFLAIGQCVLWADDLGDPDYAPGQISQTIHVGTPVTPSTLEITSTPAAAVVGAEYDVTTRLTPSAGTITLEVPVASRDVCSVAGSTVTFDHVGTCTVRALFAGDGATLSSSAVQEIEVLRAATDLDVEMMRDTIVATVTVREPGGGTPTGAVVFTSGGAEIGTAELAVDGAGDLVAWVVAPSGPLDVTATYAGSDDYLGSSAGSTRIDPVITALVTSRRPVTKHGWYRAPVKISFTCTVGSAPLVGGCPGHLKLTKNRRGLHPITVGIVAEDGGAAEVNVAGIRIDRTDPNVRVRGAKAGRTYADVRTLRCVARDRLSGADRCRVTQRVLGDRVRFRAVGFDRAGNRTVVRGRYFLR